MKYDIDRTIDGICRGDSRYHADAYEFVLDALNYTQKKYRRSRHVSGKELLEGIKELTMEQFGPMANSVLTHWGITKTEDFGNIVFNLVEKKLLSKTDTDSMDDFKNVYDFDRIFTHVYRKRLDHRIRRLR